MNSFSSGGQTLQWSILCSSDCVNYGSNMKNPNVTKTINLPYNNLQRSGAGLRSLVNTVPACFILSKTRLVQSVTAIG